MESLEQIYQRHCVTGPDVGHGDKGGTHSYIPEYERLLAPYRHGCTFMEIGLAMGLSLAMWREYMPSSLIYGVDISIVFDRKQHEHDATVLIEADATKPEFIKILGDVKLDVVIDDGSHMTADQVATFKLLKPKMKPGGLYIIEDILSLEGALPVLRDLHSPMTVIDLRAKKNRFDDVILVFHF
jgi:8-demethyl-8-alpha-L-rhamnosyltetracenomycin-C 2'-O-methyltransferase